MTIRVPARMLAFRADQTLQTMGDPGVAHLDGGSDAWTRAGKPVEGSIRPHLSDKSRSCR